MNHEDAVSHVKSGLRLAALAIVSIATIGLFLAGVAYAFFPSGHSHLLGWLFFVTSGTIMVLTMDRWATIFSGLLAYGVISGIIAVATNHLPGRPTGSGARFEAIILTLFFAASAYLSLGLRSRKLNMVDRVALMGFLLSIAVGAGYDSWKTYGTGKMPPSEIPDYLTAGIGLSFLLISWAYNFSKRQHAGTLSI